MPQTLPRTPTSDTNTQAVQNYAISAAASAADALNTQNAMDESVVSLATVLIRTQQMFVNTNAFS